MQIAAHAGVSRSWLYAQPELRDQLRGLTAISETAESAPARIERGSDASLRQRLTLAHERIRELDNENRQPPSTWAWRTHLRTVSAQPTPSSRATSLIAAHSDSCCSLISATIRTARSRSAPAGTSSTNHLT
jgi:hypothetical protein